MICMLSRDQKAFRFDVLLIDYYKLGYEQLQHLEFRRDRIRFIHAKNKDLNHIIETNLFRDDIKENFSK